MFNKCVNNLNLSLLFCWFNGRKFLWKLGWWLRKSCGCLCFGNEEWPQAASLDYGKEKLWLFSFWVVSVSLCIKCNHSVAHVYIVSVVKHSLTCGFVFSYKNKLFWKILIDANLFLKFLHPKIIFQEPVINCKLKIK